MTFLTALIAASTLCIAAAAFEWWFGQIGSLGLSSLQLTINGWHAVDLTGWKADLAVIPLLTLSFWTVGKLV